MNTKNGVVFMFIVLSGVLQGCPLSGSLFVVAIDPLLHMFKLQLESPSLAKVRACADDIGMALSQLRHLPIAQKVFASFKCVSGLNLKATKCIIILSSFLASPPNCTAVRDWLSVHCPGWEDMLVCNSAKYLGIHLGPHCGRDQWKKAIAKFKDRVDAINALHLPAGLAKVQYSSRALPV